MDGSGAYKIPYNYSEAGQFHEGRAIVDYQNCMGAIDAAGNLSVPNKYKYLGMFSEGKAYAADFKSWLGFIGLNNETIISPRYAATGIFINGFAVAMDTVNFMFGHIDPSGEFRIPPVMQDAQPFWEGLAAVKVDGKWGFTDTLGNMVVSPTYDDVLGGFCEGMAGIRMNEKWGYIDKTGQVIIQPQFKECDVFYCGRAMVLLDDDHLAYTDKTGKIIWKSPIRVLKSSGDAPMIRKDFEKYIQVRAVSDRAEPRLAGISGHQIFNTQ